MQPMTLWGKIKAAFSSSPRQFNYESQPYSILLKGMFGQPPNGRYGFDTRQDAMQIPAIRKGRNMICSSIATLPLQAVNERNEVQDHPLLRQIDPNVANVVTIAQTLEDLLFDAVAWWEVTSFAYGMPATAVRHHPSQVSFQPPPGYNQGWLPSDLPTEGVVYMRGNPVPFDRVIRFDSPNPPLLKDAERVVRRAIALYLSAETYANEPRPMDYFTPTDPLSDPGGDDDTFIEKLLDDWAAARRKRSTAYVPAALTYNEVQQPTPADLQLVQLQQQVNIDLANMIGIDAEDVGVSTTTRTYQNGVDRRKDRVNDLLSPYMSAVTQRLTMPDVTRRGITVRFWLDDYLRADPKTRAEVHQIYHDMGVESREYIGSAEGVPAGALPPAPIEPRTPIQVSPATVREINSAAPRESV
jgi:Phage portal protein